MRSDGDTEDTKRTRQDSDHHKLLVPVRLDLIYWTDQDHTLTCSWILDLETQSSLPRLEEDVVQQLVSA